jgi:hypothetical protein
MGFVYQAELSLEAVETVLGAWSRAERRRLLRWELVTAAGLYNTLPAHFRRIA